MIRFDPLTQAEFESYLAQAMKGYAAGPTRDGRWKPKEASEEKSRDGGQGRGWPLTRYEKHTYQN